MANVTLAQHEQLLKQLEHVLNEVGDQHRCVCDILTEVQVSSHQAQDVLNQAWSKVINLTAIVFKESFNDPI